MVFAWFLMVFDGSKYRNKAKNRQNYRFGFFKDQYFFAKEGGSSQRLRPTLEIKKEENLSFLENWLSAEIFRLISSRNVSLPSFDI